VKYKSITSEQAHEVWTQMIVFIQCKHRELVPTRWI